MAIQLTALALAAGRVPLSARFPQPAETQAAAEMLVAQVVAGGLLFPLLLKDGKGLMLSVAGVWPMLFLAADLSGEDTGHIAAAGIYVTGWLVALALWKFFLTSESSIRIALCLVLLWSIGGSVLLYIRAEYGNGATDSALWNAAGGPVVATLGCLNHSSFSFENSIPLLSFLIGGAILSARKNLSSASSH